MKGRIALRLKPLLGTLSACLLCLAAQQPAPADWDDVQPAPEAKQPSPQSQVQAQKPAQPVIESDEEWAQRKHTPEEIMARVRMQQSMLLHKALGEFEESRRPKLIPVHSDTPVAGSPSYHQQGVFSQSVEDSPFFGGIKQDEAAKALSKPVILPFDPTNCSPEWAKQKQPQRHFVDGVEKFGNEDPMGFF